MPLDYNIRPYHTFMITPMIQVCYPRTYPLLLVAMELDTLDGGAKALELIHPVVQGGLGHNDKVRARNPTVLIQVSHQADGLQGLAKSLR